MILVTVGMQLGFDRLIEAMDQLAPTLNHHVIAQTGRGDYVARHLEQHVEIAPWEFDDLMQHAHLIVGHAGIGTVLAAVRSAKPLVLLPWRAALKEHRNDHQLATCRQLEGRSGIYPAFKTVDLSAAIASGLTFEGGEERRDDASLPLQEAVRQFIELGRL
ncbi:MAG: glycosyltransferase [Pseudomonadota bacterium]